MKKPLTLEERSRRDWLLDRVTRFFLLWIKSRISERIGAHGEQLLPPQDRELMKLYSDRIESWCKELELLLAAEGVDMDDAIADRLSQLCLLLGDALATHPAPPAKQ